MSNETEVDMKDVELNEVEQEKQPMTEGEAGNNYAISPVSEKNGIVKVKIPDEESKFTGLSKEELMKVAGTAGWIRVRWALLILFWLGWLGMLAGAIAIIIQAPRCKPLPEMNWWNYGPLYQIGDVAAFTNSSDMKDLAGKLQALDDMKVKGLVIGPIHVSSEDKIDELELTEISKDAGDLTQFKEIIQAAHKRSISIVLDLTPNYKGKEPWFSSDPVRAVEKVEPALIYWLQQGVDGFLFYGVEKVSAAAPTLWNDVETLIHNQTELHGKTKKVLIGVTDQFSPDEIAATLDKTGVDLLLSGALRSKSPNEIASAVDCLYSPQNQTQLAWNIGGRVAGHMASIVGLARVKMSQLLLLTLPGTPVFNYGDEIGLQDESNKYPTMLWNFEQNDIPEDKQKELSSIHAFFKKVSIKRMKERSLQHGEYFRLWKSDSAIAYLREWDQNERYLIALNWHSNETATLNLKHDKIPKSATVVFSTSDKIDADTEFDLAKLEVKPEEGIMLKFPYTS